VGHIPVDYPIKAAHSPNATARIVCVRFSIYARRDKCTIPLQSKFLPGIPWQMLAGKGPRRWQQGAAHHFNIQLFEGGASISRCGVLLHCAPSERKLRFLSPRADQNHKGSLGIVK
jgi:hypothetical protein